MIWIGFAAYPYYLCLLDDSPPPFQTKEDAEGWLRRNHWHKSNMKGLWVGCKWIAGDIYIRGSGVTFAYLRDTPRPETRVVQMWEEFVEKWSKDK